MGPAWYPGALDGRAIAGSAKVQCCSFLLKRRSEVASPAVRLMMLCYPHGLTRK